MAKAELGRIPIMAAIIKRCYGYCQHLLNTTCQSFTHTALRANLNFDRRGWDSYYSRIKSLLATLEMKDKIYPVENDKIRSTEIIRIVYGELEPHQFGNHDPKPWVWRKGTFVMQNNKSSMKIYIYIYIYIPVVIPIISGRSLSYTFNLQLWDLNKWQFNRT